MPTETENFGIQKPLNEDAPPSIEDAVGPGFDDIDALFGAIDLSQLTVPGGEADDGKLVIVNSGAAAYKAMSGDVTIDKDGKAAIGKEKVGSEQIKPKAVGTGQVNDGAMTGDKFTETVRGEAGVNSTSQKRAGKAIIPAEQSTTSESFTLLETPDEVKDVLLPEGGLLFVAYDATVKASTGNGQARLYLDGDVLQSPGVTGTPSTQRALIINTANRHLLTCPSGLICHNSSSIYGVTQPVAFPYALATEIGEDNPLGGVVTIFAPAGTYDVSIKFRATSGTVTAKNRKLWVWTRAFG